MELLQQPEIKSKYDKCKYKVKYWEHHFKKKNGRLPSKLDIREASNEIRYAYKTYFNLKSAALEQSFQDIDGFNSDDDLDHENSEENSNIPTPNVSNTETRINYNKSLEVDNEANNPDLDQTSLISNTNTNDSEKPGALRTNTKVNTEKTWGSHLNNIEQETKSNPQKLDANSSFTKKLFKSSSFKRNPRKSLSFHHRKSESNFNSSSNSISLSQPTATGSSAFNEANVTSTPDDTQHESFNFNLNSHTNSSHNPVNILNADNVRVTKLVEPIYSKSLNIAQSVHDERFMSTRTVDVGWLTRVAASSGTKLSNNSLRESNFSLSQQINSNLAQEEKDYDSDDIIGDSDDEEDSKLHFNKKRKLNNGQFIQNLTVSGQSQELLPINSVPIIEPVIELNEPKIEKPTEKDTFKMPEKQVEKVHAIVKSKAIRKKSNIVEHEEIPETRKSTRNRKTIVALEPDEIDADPFINDEDNDPNYSLQTEKQDEDVEELEENSIKETSKTKKSGRKSVTKTPKSKKQSKIKSKPSEKQKKKQEKETEVDNEEKEQTYELEFSVKPRRVTVPRDPNFKNVIKKSKPQKASDPSTSTATTAKTRSDGTQSQHQIQMEKFEKKVARGTLNDNYVRINIQKKIYARGKKTMNFSKYKKKMWKQQKKANALCGPDMDMRGCDGGQMTCFQCGQVGHFAQKCPTQKGDRLLPLAAGEEDYCPFPTLEEASDMAKGSALAVRKTRTADEVDENVQETEKANDATGLERENSTESDSDLDLNKDLNTNTPNKNIEFTLSDDDDDAYLLAETLKIEEYVKKMEEQQIALVDNSQTVQPYYNNPTGELPPTPQEVYDVLKMFGHESFRAGQERAIMRILSGQSTLVTLSTGSGKSLCYQIPAYLYAQRSPCITLVISPLVSLMEDQVTGIPAFLKAECLHTNKTKMQRERILNAIGMGDLNVLLVSPEAVVAGEKQTGFGSLLRKLPPIAFACIDEAHCVSQWSHNFRPSYLMICSILKERLGVKTILGLTATATMATSNSIVSHLSIHDGRKGIISDKPLPDNLRLTVSKDFHRDPALLNLLISERFENLKSIIVYCTRRQECERIAGFLRTSLKDMTPAEGENPTTKTNKKKRKKANIQAEPYHAGLSASKRRSIQNSFMRGDLRIVVATIAFGMGIDKSDIRAVIHYNLPRNFESYVQEVGRAGRDGLPAHCHLFLDAQGRDENELQRHIFSDSIDRHVIRKLLAKIFVPCTCKAQCPKHEVAFSVQQTVLALDIPEENISTLLCYLELHDQKYIEVLSPAYTSCKITAYGSANYIRIAAKDCPPLAMALAMFGNKENEKENIFEFPVVDVAAAMGWDSGICKYKLKNLEWTTENNQPKRSFLTVEFLDLGFRLLAPGNLSGEQLDEALDTLHKRVVDQEKCSLLQLRSLHETVTSNSETTYRMCISDHVTDKERKLKENIREYFESEHPLEMYELKPKECDEGEIANDSRAMINMYRDNSFTGRALARIFYGIQSPNYPAVVWGRCKYWRAHINSDFHKIVQIATREILKQR